MHNINILMKLFLQQRSRGKLTHWHSCGKNTFIFCVSSSLIILPFFSQKKALWILTAKGLIFIHTMYNNSEILLVEDLFFILIFKYLQLSELFCVVEDGRWMLCFRADEHVLHLILASHIYSSWDLITSLLYIINMTAIWIERK